MKRIIITRFFCLLLGTLFFFSSCKREEPYTNALPAESTFVVTTNLDNLAKKANLSTVITPDMVTSMTQSLQDGLNPKTAALIEQIIKNPAESGLDFSKDVFLFVNAKEKNIGLLLAVNQAEKLRKVFDSLAEEGVCRIVKSEGGLTTLTLGDGDVCLFTDNGLMLLSKSRQGTLESALAVAEVWMTQPEANSLFANKEFCASLAEREDLDLWFTLAQWPDDILAMYKQMLPGVDLTTINYNANVQFENGVVRMSTLSYSTDSATQRQLTAYNDICGKMTGRFLNFVPANSWLCSGANIKDGAAIGNLYSNHEALKQMMQMAAEKTNIDIMQLFSSIKGDILIEASQPMNAKMPVPQMAIFVETTDNALVNAVNRLLAEKKIPVEQVSPDNYRFSIPFTGIEIYWGYRDGYCYFTNDGQVYSVVTGTSSAQPFTFAESDKATLFKSETSAFLFDMPLFLGAYQSLFPPALKVVVPVLAEIRQIEMTQNGMESQGEMTLSNTSENSLGVLVSLIVSQINKK